MMDGIMIGLLLTAIPVVAYLDFLILRGAFEAEYKVKVKWTYWLVPTFMEVVMFLAGFGLAILVTR